MTDLNFRGTTTDGVAQPAPSSSNALAPMVAESELQKALLTAVGFDKLSAAQRELALAISRQYGLDPMLRHLVIVEGKPYITRDGLLHVAHKSGEFEGIQIERPTLDDDGKYWRTWATVYRKGFRVPFRYPGRYPATSGNVKYAEEMAIKVAEVMTLRRAFDVAAPVIEERWADESAGDEPSVESPKPLTDRIAARAAEIEASLADDPGPHAVGLGQALAEMEDAGEIVTEPTAAELDPDLFGPEPIEGREAPPDVVEQIEEAETHSAGEEATEAPPQVPLSPDAPPDASARIAEQPTSAEGPTLEEFADLTSALERSLVQATAKRLFPDRKGFKELTPAELGQVLDELSTVDVDDAIDDAAGMGDVARQETGQETTLTGAAPKPPAGIKFCAAPSPYGDGKTCTMDAGHGGPHRAGVSASW